MVIKLVTKLRPEQRHLDALIGQYEAHIGS
jgi:hypothetical protein